MTTKCPACGADSATDDYCDQCGAALSVTPPAEAVVAAAVSTPAAPPAAAAMDPCPNCGAARTADDTFCEGCGLDFATGQMPVAAVPPTITTSPAGAPSGWTAVVEADRAFFDGNDAGGLAFPDGVGERRIPLTGDEVVIGRRSEAKGFFPGIDLSSPVSDAAVSHRHAALRKQADGTWALIDEMSTNGTYLNGSDQPVANGVLTALHDGDHFNLGSFTRITIVKDTP